MTCERPSPLFTGGAPPCAVEPAFEGGAPAADAEPPVVPLPAALLVDPPAGMLGAPPALLLPAEALALSAPRAPDSPEEQPARLARASSETAARWRIVQAVASVRERPCSALVSE